MAGATVDGAGVAAAGVGAVAASMAGELRTDTAVAPTADAATLAVHADMLAAELGDTLAELAASPVEALT